MGPAIIDNSSTFSHWFGLVAMYTTALCLLLSIVVMTGVVVWLVRKLWRMRYRGEGWWD